MKTETPAPSFGVVDALSAGLSQARRRPWLMLIPALLDFWLWLGPRFSIQPLVTRFMAAWEELVRLTYSPAQLASIEPLLQTVREGASGLSTHANLAETITGGWLAAPSLLSLGQTTRMTFISDVVLAPAGLSPQHPQVASAPLQLAPILIGGLGQVFLIAAGFWLVGQFVVAAYLRLAGDGWRSSLAAAAGQDQASPSPWRGLRGLLRLGLRLAALSLLVGALTLVLRTPLAVGLALLYLSGNSVAGMLALMLAGVALWLTLWFLTAVFFVAEALLLEGCGLRRGLAESVGLVLRNFGRAISLAAVINLVLYGFRIVWGLVARDPLGVPVAILGNAYLVTGMLLASFTYFDSLRHAPVPEQAKLAH